MRSFEFGEYENGEPFVRFRAMGQDIEANYWNASLFTHGQQDHVDHFFIEMEADEEERYKVLGAFVWRQATSEFDELVEGLVERDFVHIHRPYPTEDDLAVYEQSGFEPGVEPEEPEVIVEEDDDAVVEEAMAHIDAELNWFLGEADGAA